MVLPRACNTNKSKRVSRLNDLDAISILTKSDATCEDLLICLFNLTLVESDIFYELASKGPSSLDDLAKRLGRDRTSIHRCLSKLVSVGLCYKESRTLKDGGYYHVYTAVELPKIKTQAKMKADELTRSLQRLVENLESDFRKHLRERKP